MDIGATAINAGVMTAIGLVLGWLGKGRFDAFEKRMDAFDGRMDAFQSSLDGMRSDLTAVALAVGARPRAGNG